MHEEILRAGIDMETAYDAVRRLRPGFLDVHSREPRPASASLEPTVFIDGVARGGVRELDAVPAWQVASIRLLSETDGFFAYGYRAKGWVIVVETIKTVVPRW